MSRDVQYIGMDVHKEAIVIAVINDGGKLVMESIIATKPVASCSLSMVCEANYMSPGKKGPGQPGSTLLQPHVHQVLVCDPRRNALLKEGNKSDKVDAHKLANLLRTGMR